MPELYVNKLKKKFRTTSSLQKYNDSVFIIFILIDFGLPNPLVSPQPIIDEGSSPPCLFLLQTPLPCPCRNEPRGTVFAKLYFCLCACQTCPLHSPVVPKNRAHGDAMDVSHYCRSHCVCIL